jgi:hypothetical protein
MHRIASLGTLLAVSFTAATCAKKPPTIGGPPPPPKPPQILAEAAPEPIATPGIWFAFDPDFIRNRYRSADLAFGTFTVSDEWRVSLKHGETCSGEDAEVHVGSYASVNAGRLIRTYPPLPRYAAPSAVLCRSV